MQVVTTLPIAVLSYLFSILTSAVSINWFPYLSCIFVFDAFKGPKINRQKQHRGKKGEGKKKKKKKSVFCYFN